MANTRQSAGSGITMAHLAALAGVSAITVSRALANSPLVTEQTRNKVRKIATEQGYRLNISARNLRTGRSHSVAVVVEMTSLTGRPMPEQYPLELLGGITQELTMAGYSVVLTSDQLLDTAPVRGADGMILLGHGLHGDIMKSLQQSGLPLVVWGAPDPACHGIVVGSDNRTGGASAAVRLLALGRRKLVFLGDIDHVEVQERCTGFIDALGGACTAHIIRPIACTFEAGCDSIAALLRKKGSVAMDGLFAASDVLAMGAIRALVDAGRTVPGDVSVIGYDDMPGAASFVPALTSVHQDLRDGGKLLGRKMLALLRGEPVVSERVPTTLVARQT